MDHCLRSTFLFLVILSEMPRIQGYSTPRPSSHRETCATPQTRSTVISRLFDAAAAQQVLESGALPSRERARSLRPDRYCRGPAPRRA